MCSYNARVGTPLLRFVEITYSYCQNKVDLNAAVYSTSFTTLKKLWTWYYQYCRNMRKYFLANVSLKFGTVYQYTKYCEFFFIGNI